MPKELLELEKEEIKKAALKAAKKKGKQQKNQSKGLLNWKFKFVSWKNHGNYIKETTNQTVVGFHIVACMESYNWLMNTV